MVTRNIPPTGGPKQSKNSWLSMNKSESEPASSIPPRDLIQVFV